MIAEFLLILFSIITFPTQAWRLANNLRQFFYVYFQALADDYLGKTIFKLRWSRFYWTACQYTSFGMSQFGDKTHCDVIRNDKLASSVHK